MAELLKNMFFTEESLNKMAASLKKCYPDFDHNRFIELIYDEHWKNLELKQRMRHTTTCLHEVLPKEYSWALEILQEVAPVITGFEAMVLPDYVECYGMENWGLSLPALKYFTQFASSEFAIRPFLNQNLQKTMDFLYECTEHKNENVRRFASEGCRPGLPWAMAVPELKKNPTLILPILEKLKNDTSEFVRRSVANNWNDISKDHPKLTLDSLEKWYGQSANTDSIVKHACRSLLKRGNKRAMMLFGYADPTHIDVQNFNFDSKEVRIGNKLNFSFILLIKEDTKTKVRLEYGIYYKTSRGNLSKKVFKITESEFLPGEHLFYRRQSFQNMSTRKHYPGEHLISIIVNGVEKIKKAVYVTQK